MKTQTEAFKRYLDDCDKHAIVPDVAGAFNFAWQEALAQPEHEKERCVGCEACIDTACGRDECPKGWPKAAQPEQEPVAYCDIHHLPEPCVQCAKEHEGYNIPPQPKEPEQGPDVYIPADALRQLKGTSLLILRSVPLYGYRGDGLTPLYTTPPQRKPLTREQRIQILKDNTVQGYHGDYFDAWGIIDDVEAAHGIKE